MSSDLQVITVTYKSEDALDLNYRHTDLSGVSYKWANVINHKPIMDIHKDIQCIEGIKKPDDLDGSIHHGMAVNKAIETLEIDSKYLLILDSDFFIFKRMKETLDYISEKGLDFFGCTYPKVSPRKMQMVFPCGFCLFINTETIDVKSLNFLPNFEDKTDNIYRDMSYRVYEQYVNNSKYETLQSYSQSRPEEYYLDKELFSLHFRIKRHFRDTQDHAYLKHYLNKYNKKPLK